VRRFIALLSVTLEKVGFSRRHIGPDCSPAFGLELVKKRR